MKIVMKVSNVNTAAVPNKPFAIISFINPVSQPVSFYFQKQLLCELSRDLFSVPSDTPAKTILYYNKDWDPT